MLLGEHLIAEGHLDQDGLEEALDWQVLYGGRLGTNLLELQLVPEEKLARALGKQSGCEVTWGDLTVDPALIPLIPKHFADRQEIVPWKIDRRRLKMLCTEIRLEELDQLGYKLGRVCVAVVAPEFRVFNLLRAHYGALRQMRALDFGVVPEEGREERRRNRHKDAPSAAKAPPGPDLIDESAFHDMYNQVIAGRTAPALAAPQSSWAPASSWQTNPPPPGPEAPAASLRSPAAPARAPVARPVAAAAPQPRPEPVEALEPLPLDAILGPVDAAMGEGEPAPAPAPAWDAPPDASPADESPLGFKEALAALEGVTDRDSIAHLVLRASRAKAERALLMTVQGGVALGWDGLGEGFAGGLARAIAVPLGAASAFQLVVKTRSHFLGPLQKTPLNIRFLAQGGRKNPLSALLLPILHRGRVTHLLYLDNGHRQQAPTDVGEMLILSQRIAQSVDALMDRKRKAARG